MLSDIGRGLSSGGFLPGRSSSGVDLSFLNPLVSLNPEATRTAFDLASRDVVRLRNDAQQQINNSLEASNQLTSSVAVNRLADLNESFSSDIADIASQFYLADVERMYANTASLFGTGLNTLQSSAQLGLTDQGQRNEFNLQNYGNYVAQSALQQQNQKGGFSGALQGALGGGLSGFAIGGPWGAAIGAGVGGLAGGLGNQQTGGSVLGAGSFLAGARGTGGLGGGTFSLPSIFPSAGGGGSTNQTAIFDEIVRAARNHPGFGSAGGLV